MNIQRVQRLGAFLVGLLLGACSSKSLPLPAGDFAALARSTEGFAVARPGYEMEFPRDHGPHSAYRIEWWYLSANLQDTSGRPYGVQWTLFRLAMQPSEVPEPINPWQGKQVYMAHIALSWPEGHAGFQRYARGGDHGGLAQAGASAAPFSVWLDDWALQSTGMQWLPLEVRARQDNFAFQLSMDSQQPLILQGEAGFSQKHPDGSGSLYYSQPFLQATGSLTIDGEDIPVQGEAWLDREWSSHFLQPDQAGWDWFALHLESGEKLMLYRLRPLEGAFSQALFQFGVLISPDGGKTPLKGSLIRFDPLRIERVADRELPVSWRIGLPEISREFQVRALIPGQWMNVDFAYWEGAVVVEGDNAGSRGRGYLEMTGYPSR
ncbi:MAG TPA: lipocalin-like domain-containing protein [Xanthomonadales bacterium]|nr:lipocalin-like domain-containing protein [Xanthomonadales bacterium]